MSSYRNSGVRLPIMQGSPPALIPQRADWDRPPWNRWAFQNVREILPTAEVWRGRGAVRELPRADRDLDALMVKGAGGDAVTLAPLLDETYTDGFLVIKDGAAAYERYFNGMTERGLHLSQSMAKSVTAAAAGYALADGGFNACLRDYGRFGLLYLEGGIVPHGWIEATRNGNHAIFHAPYTFTLPEGAYKNQWWIEDMRSRAIMARGVFGQMIYVNWDYNLVAVKLSIWPDFLNVDFNIATLAAIHTLAGELS